MGRIGRRTAWAAVALAVWAAVLAGASAAGLAAGSAGGLGADPAARGREPPRCVILLIGDGMGFEHVRAASLFAAGAEGTLSFEPHYRGEMTTHSLDSHRTRAHATDSAAAATALATGRKTKNAFLGVDPSRRRLPTVLEHFQAQGKWTGLVTSVWMTHATPAGFASHRRSRRDYAGIARDYFEESRPNLLLGACEPKGRGVTEPLARGAGYAVVATRDELRAFVQHFGAAADAGWAVAPRLSGQFALGQLPYEFDARYGPETDEPATVDEFEPDPTLTYKQAPHLSEMASAALDLLDASPHGFFLMIESGAIDWAAHANRIGRVIGEVLEFGRTFQTVLDWAAGRDDTLVILTADHETGGLRVVQPTGKESLPIVFWASRQHTGANVPVYAWGLGAARLEGVTDNTGLYAVMTGGARPAARRPSVLEIGRPRPPAPANPARRP